MSRKDQRQTQALVYGAPPRADLMPPEVAQGKRENARRRGLVAIAVFVLAVVVAGVVGATWLAGVAQQRLADERRVTEQLVAEQLEYADVTRLQGRLAAVDDIRASIAGVDVSWRSEVLPYLRVLNDDEVVGALTLTSNVPFEAPLVLEGPLRTPRSATVQVAVVTTAQPEPWRWLRAWEDLETYADASIDSIVFEDGEGYVTTVTLNLTSDALSQRATTEGETE